MRSFRRLIVVPLALLAAGLIAAPAGAGHSWGEFHWARTANAFTLQLGDNVSAAWDGYLGTAAADWSKSSVLDTKVVLGASNPKRCTATMGRVEVCNSTYGRNGWLGLASVWASGPHITQATVKLNDTYFNTAGYTSPAWRQSVMCQEVGHTLGLGHDDENFDTDETHTCMDYANNPAGNEHPNDHDYVHLEEIYAHMDSTTTVAASQTASARAAAADVQSQADWGRAVRYDSRGRPVVFHRDLGGRQTVTTFVTWAY